MNTTGILLDATKEIWHKYTDHPFVRGIEDGTLDKDRFRYYIIQDYKYLEEYAKTFAIGLAKAKSREITDLFSGSIDAIHKELNVHNGYLFKLGITEEEIRNTPRSLDNLSYTSYMLRVAYEEGEAEILAAILSCALSYERIAANMVEHDPASRDHEFYGDWIKGYTSEAYVNENKRIVSALEKLTENYTESGIRHLTDIFIACSRYELAFWEMAWRMEK